MRGTLDLSPQGLSSLRPNIYPIPNQEVSGDPRLLQCRSGVPSPCRQSCSARPCKK